MNIFKFEKKSITSLKRLLVYVRGDYVPNFSKIEKKSIQKYRHKITLQNSIDSHQKIINCDNHLQENIANLSKNFVKEM